MPQSLEKPKRFLGSARKIDPAQGGGSLTIIATALVDTGSKMDQVIFEEFKGTGNSELVLSRELAERRIFPAIDLMASATRREELLLDPPTLAASHALRKRFAGMSPINAMNDLLTDMRRHPTNEELVRGLIGAVTPHRSRTGGPRHGCPAAHAVPVGRLRTGREADTSSRAQRGTFSAV